MTMYAGIGEYSVPHLTPDEKYLSALRPNGRVASVEFDVEGLGFRGLCKKKKGTEIVM
jgi:hypothetical protein